VSVSVPVDLELTGLRVPSTLSSRKIFNGDGGMAEAILGCFPPALPPPLEASTEAEPGAEVV
jgi:hypothetical protein